MHCGGVRVLLVLSWMPRRIPIGAWIGARSIWSGRWMAGSSELSGNQALALPFNKLVIANIAKRIWFELPIEWVRHTTMWQTQHIVPCSSQPLR